MASKKKASPKSTLDIKVLKGRVYLLTQKSMYSGAKEYEASLKVLGAKVVDELGPKVTHVVNFSGTLNKTTQKKVDSLVKKGAVIEVVGLSEFRSHLYPPPRLVGQFLEGTAADHAQLFKLLRAHRYDMKSVPAETSDLSGATFENSILFRILLRDTDLSNASMPEETLRGVERCTFDGADLSGGEISRAIDSSFRHVNLEGGEVSRSLAGSTFEGANLRGSCIDLSLDKSRPSDPPVFKSANLDAAEIRDIKWTGVDFSECSAVGTQWKRVDAPAIILRGADLSKCVMNRVDLRGADACNTLWQGANLAGVDLRGAQLDGADFTGAILVDVKLDPGFDSSKIQGLEEALQDVPTLGPALKALDAAVTKAKKVTIELQLRPGAQVEVPAGARRTEHEMSFEASNRSYGFVCFNAVSSPDGRHDMEHTKTFTDGFKHNLRSCSGAEVRFETIVVKTTKSPTPGAELRELMIAALAEAFDQTPPGEKELKALTKAYRAELKRAADAKKAQDAKENAEYAKSEEAKQKNVAAQAAKERAERPEPKDPVTDFATFAAALDLRADSGRVKNAQKMLKGSGFQLFHDASDATHVIGVVKSQSDQDLVYACKLQDDGSFSCCTQNLRPCGGLRGALCKHQLVLLLGLVQAGVLDASKMDSWVKKSLDHEPALDKDQMSDVLLKYKGAEAGEIDWRPTETVPEDFYAF